MNNDFDKMVSKVIKAINEIEPDTKLEDVHKKCIIYFILKACENEEIFSDNLLILDKQAINGMNSNYQKKFRR